MTDEPLFQDSDEVEEKYVGDHNVADEAQPNFPPKMISPALENGMLTTPPLRGDKRGLKTEPIDQGALGETALTESPKLNEDEAAREESRMRDATNTDAG